MLIHQLLSAQAKAQPQRNALWYAGAWHSYAELAARAQCVANYFIAKKLPAGARVALLMENSVDCVIFYFGVLMAGGVVVGLNPGFSPEALRGLIDDCQAQALVVGKKQMRALEKICAPGSPLKIVLKEVNALNFGMACESDWQTAKGYSASHRFHRRIDLDLAEIVYTSGSTGKPKGVMLSHLNIVTNMHSIVACLQLNEHDRGMIILPLYYIYGKSLLLTHFLVGGSVVLDNRFMFPNAVIDTMASTGVTNFSGVPSTYAILLGRSNIRSASLPKLRMVTQAGGAMAVSVQREVAQVFQPAKLWVMYGATEAAPRLSYLHPDYLEQKYGSIGSPVENVELAIVDDHGRALPAGEKGEIVARGSNVMMGYWNDEQATRKALANGVLHTGDLAYRDADGFIFVVGRKNDIIKVKGFRVSSREIEDEIMLLAAVEEVAVVGVNDPLMGETIKACVVLKPGCQLSETDIVRDLRQRLPSYKLPGLFEFMAQLPKNSAGKILKTQLQEPINAKSRETHSAGAAARLAGGGQPHRRVHETESIQGI